MGYKELVIVAIDLTSSSILLSLGDLHGKVMYFFTITAIILSSYNVCMHYTHITKQKRA